MPKSNSHENPLVEIEKANSKPGLNGRADCKSIQIVLIRQSSPVFPISNWAALHAVPISLPSSKPLDVVSKQLSRYFGRRLRLPCIDNMARPRIIFVGLPFAISPDKPISGGIPFD